MRGEIYIIIEDGVMKALKKLKSGKPVEVDGVRVEFPQKEGEVMGGRRNPILGMRRNPWRRERTCLALLETEALWGGCPRCRACGDGFFIPIAEPSFLSPYDV